MKLPVKEAYYWGTLLKVAQCPASEPKTQMRVQIPTKKEINPKVSRQEDKRPNPTGYLESLSWDFPTTRVTKKWATPDGYDLWGWQDTRPAWATVKFKASPGKVVRYYLKEQSKK